MAEINQTIATILTKLHTWFGIKEILAVKHKLPKFEEGQIWWCHLGENIGHEENGKGDQFLRPVLVLKKFNKRLFYGLPTTTKIKDNKYYFQIRVLNKDIAILLSQMRTIDVNRLLYKQTRLPDAEFIMIKKATAKIILGKN